MGGQPIDHRYRKGHVDQSPDWIVGHQDDSAHGPEAGGNVANPAGHLRTRIGCRTQHEYSGREEDHAGDQPYPGVGREAVADHGMVEVNVGRTLLAQGPSTVDDAHDAGDHKYRRREDEPTRTPHPEPLSGITILSVIEDDDQRGSGERQRHEQPRRLERLGITRILNVLTLIHIHLRRS
jgi:hypothetical protein